MILEIRCFEGMSEKNVESITLQFDGQTDCLDIYNELSRLAKNKWSSCRIEQARRKSLGAKFAEGL